MDLLHKLGDTVKSGAPLYRVYADYASDLEFARHACAEASGYAIGGAEDPAHVFVGVLMKPTLLYFEDERDAALRLAEATAFNAAPVARHRFPDQGSGSGSPPNLPAQVVIFRSLHQPNEKLVELLLVARTARELGARRLTLVSPYLAYMRQDIAFNPGEVVSQRVVAPSSPSSSTISSPSTASAPHSRTGRSNTARKCGGAFRRAMLAALIAGRRKNPLVGPDAESAQWVASGGRSAYWDRGVCSKLRHGDREVEVALPAGLAVQAGRWCWSTMWRAPATPWRAPPKPC